jgi:hypothetical protein
MSFKPNKIRVIEFDTDYINSLKLIVDEDNKIKDAFTGFIISPYHGIIYYSKDSALTDYLKSTKIVTNTNCTEDKFV